MSKQLTFSSILAIIAMGGFAMLATAHTQSAGDLAASQSVVAASQAQL